jgi:hypothetical protein
VRYVILLLLCVACEAGVQIESSQTDADQARSEAPSGSAPAPPPTTPDDGRPEVAEADRVHSERRAAWPPVVVPQDRREREWNWDFEVTSNSRTQRLRDNPSDEEGHAIEQAQMRELGHDPEG